MLGKRSILAKLAGQRIRLMRHNSPLIRATPFGPPMRIHLAQRMNSIPKKVILRSRIHHSLHVKQVKIQSQMNERVHIIDFHISSNNHPSQTLGHKKSSNQNQFSQLRARQDGTHAPIATDPACCRKRSSSVSNNVNLGALVFSFVNNPQRGPRLSDAPKEQDRRGSGARTFYKTKGQGPRWDGYLETLADHSQQPTGSPSMSTLPPSKS